MATKKEKNKRTSTPAVAMHAVSKDGRSHVVGVGNIRVLLKHDRASNCWFARGVDIDYAAQGNSESDVKRKFGDGLCRTIHENLKVHGTIEKLLRGAPRDVWTELYRNANTLKRTYSQVSAHRIQPIPLPRDVQEFLPFFEGLQFIPVPKPTGVAVNA